MAYSVLVVQHVCRETQEEDREGWLAMPAGDKTGRMARSTDAVIHPCPFLREPQSQLLAALCRQTLMHQ